MLVNKSKLFKGKGAPMAAMGQAMGDFGQEVRQFVVDQPFLGLSASPLAPGGCPRCVACAACSGAVFRLNDAPAASCPHPYLPQLFAHSKSVCFPVLRPPVS